MQRFLYFITAHHNPDQLRRLVAALLRASPQGEVLVHYDPAGPSLPPNAFADEVRVHLVPAPMRVRWGDFSLVDAFLAATTWARAHVAFDWLIWISGQDYPLAPLNGFETDLAVAPYDGYLRHFPAFGHAGWPLREGDHRYLYRYWNLPSFPQYYLLPKPAKRGLGVVRRWFNLNQGWIVLKPRYRDNPAKLGLRRRRTPFSATRPCYAGWTWLNINTRALDRILQFAQSHPEYVAYYRHTYCPDESFFHTILANEPDLKIKNTPLRHVAWEERLFPTHPRTITTGASLDAALASGMPFGRKFDATTNSACLDLLDARIAGETPS